MQSIYIMSSFVFQKKKKKNPMFLILYRLTVFEILNSVETIAFVTRYQCVHGLTKVLDWR